MFSEDSLNILVHYHNSRFISNLATAQRCGMREIKELINSKTIRLSDSDKAWGKEFVVILRQLYVMITEELIDGAALYRP